MVSQLGEEVEVQNGWSQADSVVEKSLVIGSFEEGAASHHFHRMPVEVEVGLADLGEEEEEPEILQVAVVWKELAACGFGVGEVAGKPPCQKRACFQLEVMAEVSYLLLAYLVLEGEEAGLRREKEE